MVFTYLPPFFYRMVLVIPNLKSEVHILFNIFDHTTSNIQNNDIDAYGTI